MNIPTPILYIMYFLVFYMSLFWIAAYIRLRNKREKKIEIKEYPSVSILITAYNEKKHIGNCIKSCLKLDYPKDKIEIIVVDDGSTDNTYKLAKSFEKQGVRIFTKKNSGKADSINYLLKKAKGEIVSILDADSYFTKDAMKRLVANFSDEKTAAVIPMMKVKNPKNFWEKVQFAEYLYFVLMREMLSKVDGLYITHGIGSVFRKDLLIKAGGFEPGNLTEDMEIALKLTKMGYKIKADTSAITYTSTPSDMKSLNKQRVRWYVGALYNMKKYKELMFNPKYGHLGLFCLPVNLLSSLMVLFLATITISSIYDAVKEFFISAQASGFDVSYLLNVNTPHFNIFSIKAIYIFGFLGLLIGGVIFFLSMSRLDKTSKEKKTSLLYFFPYAILSIPGYMIFWCFALLSYLFKGGKVKQGKRTW